METNDLWAFQFLWLTAVVFPLSSIRTYWKLGRGENIYPPRKRLFTQTIVIQGVVFATALAAAHFNNIRLFSSFRLNISLGWGVLFLAVTLGTLPFRWKHRSKITSERMRLLVPHERDERILYFAVCVAAAISEEVAYRGVMLALFQAMIPDSWGPLLLCSAIFAVNHMVQGWRAVVLIFTFALGFHGLVFASGSLYLAMFVHFVYDMVAGLLVGRWNQQEGPPQAAGGVDVVLMVPMLEPDSVLFLDLPR